MKLKFTKLHTNGNDFIYINCLDEEPKADWPELVTKMSRRHFGIGSDGLVLMLPSDKADYKMRMFNTDGSEAEINGNGLRGMAKYLYDRKITDKKNLKIETIAGVKEVEITKLENDKVSRIKVNLGQPILDPEKIPVKASEKVINQELELTNQCVDVTCLSLGNPHCVLFLDSFSVPIERIGPEIANHKMFPNRTNVEFIQIVNKNEINMQIWERGVGVTLCSGTGAAASVIASVLNNKTDRKVKVKLLEGELDVEWNQDNNNVYIEGPAEEIYNGEYEIK